MILQLQMREIQLQQILVSHFIIMQGKLPIIELVLQQKY
jgi:hypothetical protein